MSNILITKAFCSTAVGSSKFVLIVLADAANSDSQTWQGLDTLAAKTGLSRSAIKNAMVRLVEDKHITMDRRYNKAFVRAISKMKLDGLPLFQVEFEPVNAHGASAVAQEKLMNGAPVTCAIEFAKWVLPMPG